MEKETRIEAPNGCEIKKVEIIDGAAVVTFKEKERKLPKSWEEFCKMFPIKAGEVYINSASSMYTCTSSTRNPVSDVNVLPDRSTAEAVLALCQLIQLRDCYNGDWVPDWNGDDTKFMIEFTGGEINICSRTISSTSPLYFKTRDLRDEFLRYFRPLIEKMRPLYGIVEGGEEC